MNVNLPNNRAGLIPRCWYPLRRTALAAAVGALFAAGSALFVAAPWQAAHAAADADADAYPKRKPGLWELSTTGGPAGPTTVRHCIDAETDRLMREKGGQQGASCDKPQLSREGESYRSQVSCRVDGSTVATESSYEMEGDTAFRGTARQQFDPPLYGVAEIHLSQTGRWVGACPTTMKPGDVTMEGLPNANAAGSGRGNTPASDANSDSAEAGADDRAQAPAKSSDHK